MKSVSPYGDAYSYEPNEERERQAIDRFLRPGRQTVVVQGLGFVGAAMAAALSLPRTDRGEALYNVLGVDQADSANYWKIARVNQGKAPIVANDKSIDETYARAAREGNLLATFSPHAYAVADVVVVDINLDIKKIDIRNPHLYEFTYDPYLRALEAVASHIKQDSLVIIETTVPPGTTEKVIAPLFREAFKRRGLDPDRICLGHSYERVTPGANYLNSIINFPRVFSGIDQRSRERTRAFLESFINTRQVPLHEAHSTAASEMAKVLENSFRAMNIAFIQEWTEYAHLAGVNLFDVLEAIRVRPTHKNIMSPGFGIGGYCLTKDSLLADWSKTKLYGATQHLDMSLNALRTNDLMPEFTVSLLRKELNGLRSKQVALLGLSYLNDVADTRFSPSELFYDICVHEGADVRVHDPIVPLWAEKGIEIDTRIESLKNRRYDAAVFAVRHREYLELSVESIASLFQGAKVIVDANNLIDDAKAKALAAKGMRLIGVGKGHWDALGGSR